jgi:hypothetical protein
MAILYNIKKLPWQIYLYIKICRPYLFPFNIKDQRNPEAMTWFVAIFG